MGTISRWYEHNNGFCISFSYDAELVESLKAKIPHTHRSWDADKKEWWISKDHMKAIDELFPGFSTMVKSQARMF